MLQTYCMACRTGDHNNHQKVIRAAPEGMMGGAECRCKGECQKQPSKQPMDEMTIADIVVENPERTQ